MTTAAEVRKHINELIEKKGLTLNSISLTLRPNSPALCINSYDTTPRFAFLRKSEKF